MEISSHSALVMLESSTVLTTFRGAEWKKYLPKRIGKKHRRSSLGTNDRDSLLVTITDKTGGAKETLNISTNTIEGMRGRKMRSRGKSLSP